MIARVEPLTTARALRGPFDYRLPPELAAAVRPGSTLKVPFAGRDEIGVVTALARESELPPERLAEPLGLIGEAVPPDLVELALWVAREYCSTPARALRLVLPPGAAARHGGARRLLTASLTAAGATALDDPAARLTPGQRALLERLASEGPLAAGAAGLDHGALRRLERRGLVEIAAIDSRRVPRGARVGAQAGVPAALTADQTAALARIEAALVTPGGDGLLLHGVTGSGKTEVYLQAAASALAAGRGVLVLVPEIALAPQTVGRFAERFGDVVAVLHSRLSAGERYDEWCRLARGEARIAVGPRSAVFAPIAGLGLVVVDEEHDSAYKHEGDPRYDARTVAERRAEMAGAVLVAGSATPRPESVVRLERLRLRERPDGRPLPPIELLDMREVPHPLHPAARHALAEVRRAGSKAIVLMNRRGWSNFVSCRACGRVWECPECDVALVLHMAQAALACHHCGHREAAPSACSCGSVAVGRHGAGSERVEHELAAALGGDGFPVVRLDADAAAAKDGVIEVLERFDRAPAGVLVGTQMVAKGHDFPDVTLGIVVDADQTLRFPDFRAEERTFQLITQLAGRVGRGPAGGRVLVQTLAPEAPSIAAAALHDSDGFVAGELARREPLGYPPFAALIRVVASAPAADDARAAAAAIAAEIDAPGATVLGPAPLFRLRGRERFQLVVKAADRAAAVAGVAAAVDAVARTAAGRRASLSVDVDPQ